MKFFLKFNLDFLIETDGPKKYRTKHIQILVYKNLKFRIRAEFYLNIHLVY